MRGSLDDESSGLLNRTVGSMPFHVVPGAVTSPKSRGPDAKVGDIKTKLGLLRMRASRCACAVCRCVLAASSAALAVS